MTFNGKRAEFTIEDFRQATDRFRLFRGKKLRELLEQVDSAIGRWHEFAHDTGVLDRRIEEIARNHRRLDQMPAA